MHNWKLIFSGAVIATALVTLQAVSCHAAVVDEQANGFTLQETATIAAPQAKVFATLGDVGHWWNSEHSFSGDAKNMSIDLHAGGCWCEKLPGGGSVLHMTVVYVDPDKELRLRGALGPFQTTGLDGVMVFALKPNGASTDITVTADFGGHMMGGLGPLPKLADGVIAEQVQRLKKFVETGSPR